MTKDVVLQLKCVGVTPRHGHREYSFHIEDKEKPKRLVVLTIEDAVFTENRLMFQEAPDLCYQKLLTDLTQEAGGTPIRSRAQVTASDVANYRDSHPIAKTRAKPGMKRPH